MSFWSKLFGSSDVVKEGIGILKDAGDAMFYTDEEKAADAARSVTEARQMVVSWMQATSGQNLARRLLAVAITFVWLSMYLCSMIMNIVAVWVNNSADWIASASIVGSYADKMNGAVMLILAFYFAAPHMDKIVDGAMKRFSSAKPSE